MHLVHRPVQVVLRAGGAVVHVVLKEILEEADALPDHLQLAAPVELSALPGGTGNWPNFGNIAMKTVHLPLMIVTDEDGIFIVSCPAFKGCHSYGKTVEEAIANVREVIA